MTIRLDGQVAIVTGAGRGLGRAHAIALADRGAKVLVNDLQHADSVVAEINGRGGEALASNADVAELAQVQAMVRSAADAWGRVDILVNNAGILRDKSFAKMSMDDFRLVIDVHLVGSANCCKAVWEVLRTQNYGRIVFTTSSSGLYGNFGQANYSAAKMALVGLMNTLHLEGEKYDIRVNCLAPAAGTAMTEGLFPQALFDLLTPESVSPGVVFLVSRNAPSRAVLAAGGGAFAVYKGFESAGVSLLSDGVNADALAAAWQRINADTNMQQFASGFEQAAKFAALNAAQRK